MRGLLPLVPLLPLAGIKQYVLHVMIQIFIWSFIGGAWSLMGRFGLVSLGHGAFLGHGRLRCRAPVELLRHDPVDRRAVAMLLTGLLAAVVAYPCSRFQVVGHYFGLVTLAVGEVIRLLIVAERDWTGGSLGVSLKPAGGDSLLARCSSPTSASSTTWRSCSGWPGSGCGGAWTARWRRSAMEAIGEDETAAASVGIHVTRFKMGITVLSAALTALGGVLPTRSTSPT